MGGLLAFRVGNYDNTAEREQFRYLCRQLKAHYENSNEFCVFAGNYNIGCELDALFIKKDAIIAIEFKNYGGKVIANENGEWTCDGKVIKGGSRKTVLQQARINHSTVKKELKILGVSKENIKDVPTLIIFNQPVEITNNLSATNKSWLHITDNEHFIEKLDDITCPHTDLDPLGIVNLAELLNLNSFYLTEFSNATYDKPGEPIEKLELFEDIKKYEKSNSNNSINLETQESNLFTNVESADQPLEQDVQLVECNSQSLHTTEELMPLRNYAEQIVSAVWGRSTFTINVLPHDEFATIFADYSHCIKQEHLIILEADFSDEERIHLQKFLHKEVIVVNKNLCFWQTDDYVDGYSPEQAVVPETTSDNDAFSHAIEFPQWLDDIVFTQLGAKFAPDHNRFEYNLNLNKEEVLVYLGTYFPRSFTEVYSLFKELMVGSNYAVLTESKKTITILDLGCGTGGDIIGLLCFIEEYLPFVESVKVMAIDGNHDALRVFEKVLCLYKAKSRLNITETIGPAFIEEDADLDLISQVVSDEYDFILSCKAICEMQSKGRIKSNAYKCAAELLAQKLLPTGILLIEDVTIKSLTANEFIPVILNRELNQFVRENPRFSTLAPMSCKESGEKCTDGCFFKKEIRLSHSQKQNDQTKIVYRFIAHRDFAKSFVLPTSKSLNINCKSNN